MKDLWAMIEQGGPGEYAGDHPAPTPLLAQTPGWTWSLAGELPPLILLVDDNDDHRSMYAMYLRAAGFRVIEAADGTSAIGKAHTVRPNVILLDLYMPGLNGWQACRWLKTSVETARIPVIAITGHPVTQARQKAMEAGCDRFVAKGSDPGQVLQAIREILADTQP